MKQRHLRKCKLANCRYTIIVPRGDNAAWDAAWKRFLRADHWRAFLRTT